MNTQLVASVFGVLAVWSTAFYSIRHWGPGRAKRSVECPTRHRKARVLVEQREGDFGCLRVVDAVACSLAPESPLTCGKECLTQF